MNITEEQLRAGKDKVGDLYEHLLRAEDFIRELPAKLIQFSPREIADDLLYLSGWLDGILTKPA